MPGIHGSTGTPGTVMVLLQTRAVADSIGWKGYFHLVIESPPIVLQPALYYHSPRLTPIVSDSSLPYDPNLDFISLRDPPPRPHHL